MGRAPRRRRRRERGCTGEPLTPAERNTLAELLDVILPSESGPGASDAGAVDYVVGRLRGPERHVTAALRDALARAAPEPARFITRIAAGDDASDAALFTRLRAWAWEGFLCDPAYGGNRDRVGWARFGFGGSPKLNGYPGDGVMP